MSHRPSDLFLVGRVAPGDRRLLAPHGAPAPIPGPWELRGVFASQAPPPEAARSAASRSEALPSSSARSASATPSPSDSTRPPT